MHQCIGTNRSNFEYQVSISQVAPDYFFKIVKIRDAKTCSN